MQIFFKGSFIQDNAICLDFEAASLISDTFIVAISKNWRAIAFYVNYSSIVRLSFFLEQYRIIIFGHVQ